MKKSLKLLLQAGVRRTCFSMERLVFSTFFYFLFILHFHFHLIYSDYTPPREFFINCGSDSAVEVDGRTFVGDETSHSSFSFSDEKSSTVTNTGPSLPSSLYQTARIFKHSSTYNFSIHERGVYFVRLHFFENPNLGNALFDVSASNFSLLSNISGESSVSGFPAIEEFLIIINEHRFSVQFTPSNRKSIAFVNAIEVFLVPNDTIADSLSGINSSTRSNYSYPGVRSQVLHTVHRINVGGPQEIDTLWRNWVEDGDYSISGDLAKICTPYSGTLHYGDLGSSNYSAPEFVYNTCRESNANNSIESSFSNITWRLNVSKNSRHLVRVHFCDIISKQPGDIHFNLYIYSTYSMLIDPYSFEYRLGHEIKVATPFYWDLVVDSDDSGYLNISVGPRRDSLNKTAYLNGLEIMEFLKKVELVSDSEQGKSNKLLVVIICLVGGLVLIFILAVILVLGLKYKKAKQAEAEYSSGKRLPPVPFVGGATLSDKTSERSRTTISLLSPNMNLNLKISFGEILSATNNFDAKLLIGEGGFGKVYRGTLDDGTTVAVKRSDPKHDQGQTEFETEVLVLSKIRHRNLVSLVRYCNEGSEMILVYEFMEKGALRDHLYGDEFEKSSLTPKLSWKERLEICLGSARGLHYLHTGSAEGIVHRDVKSTNILLDEHYMAKVADFGLSRSADLEPEHFTAGIKGSFGYMDPEYYKTFQFTTKSDVYSFGVVLLEVLCARPAIVASSLKEEVNLAEWGMHWKKKGQLEKIMDPVLLENVKPDSLRKFSELVAKCLSNGGDERPTMEDVAWDLEYALQLQVTNTNGNGTVQDDSWTNVLSGFSSLNLYGGHSQSQTLISEGVYNHGESFSGGRNG